jgi:NitT/TauT family transport system permease protein
MENYKPIIRKNSYLYNLISLGLFFVLLGIWQLLSAFPNIKFFFGSPLLILESIVTNLASGVLFYSTLITGLESLSGFLIGIISGTILGFLLWYSPFIAKISRPYLFVLGAVPAFAFAPIIILWFGIGVGMKIALAAFGTFLISIIQSYEGANSVDLEKFNILRTFGASRFQILKKVIFPSSLSWVLASMKLNIGFALLGAFIGEFISSNVGLGHFMLRAGSLYDIPSVFAGSIFLILLALIFNLTVGKIEKSKVKIIEIFSVDRSIREICQRYYEKS